jgi:hypothetical protein
VYLLDVYFKRLPPFAFREDILYCRPKPKLPADKDSPWYEDCAVGKNKLGNYVSEMCAEAGISHKTNHSLRATGATRLFQSKVPEKIVQKTTGHRSLEALRKYEHTSSEQHQVHVVSKVMMSTKKINYGEALQRNECQPLKKNSVITTRNPLDGVHKLFSDLTNCNIGNITVNIGTAFPMESSVDKEFDNIAKNMELDIP